ncbi:hypothetical protein [Rhodopseudomonas sp. BR0M22]|uniref:hypothetical protein n=1 Tax=Rhodopseudomonas sp. BR0M22 TaxID=2269369 RepID=UPI0013E015FD|nr:hypothetical protein [Rhodopseudomonas sp. BR0M22]
MSKFRIKLKLQGLELEIEGSREDASIMSQSIGQQIAGMMGPVGTIIDGSPASDAASLPSIANSSSSNSARKPRRKQVNGSQTNGAEGSRTIDFKHSPEKFGNPKQGWKTAQKALWLLYVAKESANQGELASRVIADTFNKHFKQAGLVQTGNVGRDLGRLKSQSPAAVGEDTTQVPPAWFLTDEGRKQAQALVSEALGQPA